jgi:tRNA(fMet)-specific endonuclease VapC
MLDRFNNRYGKADFGISVVTVAELSHGVYRARSDSDRSKRLNFVDELCRDVPVYPVTLEIAKEIGRIGGQQAALGQTLSFEDLAIATTALNLGFDVVTLNLRHFERISGLSVLSPLP